MNFEKILENGRLWAVVYDDAGDLECLIMDLDHDEECG